MYALLAAFIATAGPLVVEWPDARFEIDGIERLQTDEAQAGQVCPVGLAWTDGALASDLQDCPEALQATVGQTIGDWKVTADPDLGDHDIARVWFVQPAVTTGGAHIGIEQHHAVQLTLPTTIDPLPFGIFARHPVDGRPADAPVDTNDATCTVVVDVDPRGHPTPHASDCDEALARAAEATLAAWRFEVPLFNGGSFESRATLLVTYPSEGPATIAFPPPPSLEEGARAMELVSREAPPMPEGEPLFVMDAPHVAPVKVYEIVWPTASQVAGVCPVRLLVNSRRFRWAFSQQGCPEALSNLAVSAAEQWVMVAGLRGEGDRQARFDGRFVFPGGGEPPTFVIHGAQLETDVEALPDGVVSETPPNAYKRVAPKARGKTRRTGYPKTRCEFVVRVDTRGRASDIDTRTCPEMLEPDAVKAIRKWRWMPARIGDDVVEAEVVIAVNFQGA